MGHLACYWPTQRRMPTYATIRKTRRKENSISVASATSHLHRITPTRCLFMSPRSFPVPRRLDALRRCPCQRNAAIPSYRGYVATGSSSSCSASLRQHFFLMSVCSLWIQYTFAVFITPLSLLFKRFINQLYIYTDKTITHIDPFLLQILRWQIDFFLIR